MSIWDDLKPDDVDGAIMSFGDHLEELRKRLILAIAAPLPLMIILFFFSAELVEWLILPMYGALAAHGLPPSLQALSPQEVLLTRLKVAAVGAIVLSGPWIIWQAWKFIAPGLYHHERRFVTLLIPGSGVLTLAGIALLYWVMLPLMLYVLVGFGGSVKIDPPANRSLKEKWDLVEQWEGEIPIYAQTPEPLSPGMVWVKAPEMELFVAMPVDDEPVPPPAEETEPTTEPQPRGRAQPMTRPGASPPTSPAASAPPPPVTVERVPRRAEGGIEQSYRLSEAINFTLLLMLAIAIAFQMPLVILLLGWLGIATAPWLRAQRKYALLVCAVVAAIITPADAPSMVMMLLPLYGLYELGILLLVLMPAQRVREGSFVAPILEGFRRWRKRPKRPGSDRTGGPGSGHSVKVKPADDSVSRGPGGASAGDAGPASPPPPPDRPGDDRDEPDNEPDGPGDRSGPRPS